MNYTGKKTLLSFLPAGTMKKHSLFRQSKAKLFYREILTACEPPLTKKSTIPVKLGQPTHLTHPHRIKIGEIVPGITLEEIKHRRGKLVENIKAHSFNCNYGTKATLVVMPSACKKTMSENIPYVFRQNSDFLYLTGCLEQDSVLVLTIADNKDESILFLRGKDPHSELWDGPRTGVDQAVTFFGVDKALPIKDLWIFIESFIKENKDCFLFYDYAHEVHPGVHKVMQQYQFGPKFKETQRKQTDKSLTLLPFHLGEADPVAVKDQKWRLKGALVKFSCNCSQSIFLLNLIVTDSPAPDRFLYLALESPRRLVHQLRLFKSTAEQELMKTSCQIGSQGIKTAMRDSRPWDNEAFIQARVDFYCRMRGAEHLAYPPVVASGDRANTIHYIDNNQVAEDGDLVLIDAGCEYHGYCSDISRTWPISGKFTPAQRILYEVLYAVQTDLIQMCCQSPTLDQLYVIMTRLLGARLKDAGVLSDKVDDAEKCARELCPHHVGHYLGMDVHDTSTVLRHIPLEPGMVCTIEPGVYINKGSPLAKPEFHGLGLRIEDDILMTNSGPLVLTSSCPKHPDDIENLFKS